ncbi:hypothetical protein NCS56_00199700 [Fusarium sp. Ph1]|nr:hypothetical protein NCS56_00199700 [Fusarium sp. Ph1]
MDKLVFLSEPESKEHFSPYQEALFPRLADDKSSRDEAQVILKGHFPDIYGKCEAFLKSKKPPPALPHVPAFELRPWRLPIPGRPSSLVLIGPPGCGKTTLALTFGHPAFMVDRWDVDEVRRPGITHVVLKNVDLQNLLCKRHLAGC